MNDTPRSDITETAGQHINAPQAGRPKEPWLAVTLSFILPGSGQIYAGYIFRGCLIIACQISSLWFALRMFWGSHADLLWAVAGMLLFLAVYIFSLLDAYRCAKKGNSEKFEHSRKQNKDPWLAVFLSNLFPGLGHFYLKKWLPGAGFLICWIMLMTIQAIWSYNLLTILGEGFSALVCYNAYVLSPIRRESSRKTIVMVAAFIFIFTLVLEQTSGLAKPEVAPFKVVSSAMSPALLQGDRILVDTTPNYSPKHGDIIVFRLAQDEDSKKHSYIFRVIAVGGDRVEIKDSAVYVNGQKLMGKPFDTIEYTATGVEKYATNGTTYQVPAEHVFVLGDNSANSRDSRYFGPILQKDVVGKAYRILWPLNRKGPVE